jgi:hypothetical protein
VLKGKTDEDLLKEYDKQWKNHKILVYWMRKIFNYLVSKNNSGSVLPEEWKHGRALPDRNQVIQRRGIDHNSLGVHKDPNSTH